VKKYRTLVKRLNVRKAPNSAAVAMDMLPIASEFFSDEEKATASGQLWAKRATSIGGWLCVYDRSTRYCEEVPLPVQPAELPIDPAPADINQRVADLERTVARLCAVVGLKEE